MAKRLGKKETIRIVSELFKDIDNNFLIISDFDIKIHIYDTGYDSGNLIKLINILKVIDESPIFDNNWDVWRTVGYYDSTDSITMDFIINKDEVKKLIKN